MKLRYFQRGFNYSEDGPGNRLVYHLKGCNMFCPWCSNPEGMTADGETIEKNIDEVIAEILSCRAMFFDGGGVTFTGGEATLQDKAIIEIIKSLKKEGIHTAIETNLSTDFNDELIDLCDYWIADFKHPNSETLLNITGGRLEVIKRNIKKLLDIKPLHIRIPLIHGFNDDTATLVEFKEYFTLLKNEYNSFDIEILPYHEYGKEKWKRCGKKYQIANGFVDKKTLEEFSNTLTDSNIKIIKT